MSSVTAGRHDPLLRLLPPGLPVSAGMALAEPPLIMLKSLQHTKLLLQVGAPMLRRPWAPHAPQGF